MPTTIVAARDRRHSGQSLVEFALILPVLLLIVLGGIDFGRVFLGWVNLNNTARIAANYAAANAMLVSAGNTAALASYNRLVQNDATATNCQPANPIPPPVYSPNAGIGSDAKVALSCDFSIITPVLSSFLGGTITVTATAVFPVRTGIVAGVPTGGSTNPVAQFNVSPLMGNAPLIVTFNNVSTGSPTSYSWDFQNDGIVDDTTRDPPSFTYSVPGTYTVVLTISDGLVTSTAQRTVTVTTPPGPIANFTANPQTGNAPLNVAFTNTSTGSIVTWAWNMGNGVTSSLQTPPNQTYGAGTWTVTLTVTDGFAQSSTTQKTITASTPLCRVPNFIGDLTSSAIQTAWTNAGFQAIVVFNPSRPPEYRIRDQTPNQNANVPCASTVLTVSP